MKVLDCGRSLYRELKQGSVGLLKYASLVLTYFTHGRGTVYIKYISAADSVEDFSTKALCTQQKRLSKGF